MQRLFLAGVVLGSSVAAAAPPPRPASQVSAANRMAELAMNAVANTGDDASIAKLDQAVAPSVDLLDTVIRTGDPYWKVVAEDAKRDIYQSMIVRERVAIPGADFAGHLLLEPKLAHWQESEHEAIAAIEQIEHANPTLAKRDAVISTIIARADEMSRPPQMAHR